MTLVFGKIRKVAYLAMEPREAIVMNADPDRIGSASRLFTSHGTTLFVDPSSNELRHGPFEATPFNTVLIPEGGESDPKLSDAYFNQDIVRLSSYSNGFSFKKNDGSNYDDSINSFALVIFNRKEFGLRKSGLFLSAEPDGRVSLSRTECKSWELFHFRHDASEVSGSIVRHRIDGQIVNFFISNRADYIQSLLLRGDFYDREALNLIRRQCLPEKTFVDIGANIGNHCIFLSKFCNPSEVIAFEPNPAAIAILRINMSLNGCSKINLDHLGLALSSKSGTMRVHYPSIGNIGGAQMLPDDLGDVKCIPGDDLLYQKPIGFIKIDVEGAEFEVLKGLKNTIELRRPNLLVEVWPQARKELEAWCSAFHYMIQESLPMDDNYFLVPKERT
ncbi:FkbM family methyltransferase [Mesorhizobium sophorae]|uniref:FkbM family methyltransferase n=1 Tax=Mesorhizobium sophorae TaxID=1300294 RepID=UPI000BA3DE77|nr:FkbM family methyltransferase [Mesorhizobium sophorae]